MKFIINKATKVYHTEDCSCIPTILNENKVETETRPLYYRPCSKCRPERKMDDGSVEIISVEVQE